MFTSISARSANAYKRVSVESSVSDASPHKLVEMLFEGLLSNVGSAAAALERGDVKAKCQHVIVAVRILEEGLKGALNLKEGGDLAANLNGVYDYCVTRLTLANVRNDLTLLQEVRDLIMPVADAWKQIAADSGSQPLPN
ncbi:MAG: flagellar export chaperone FliS [Rhodoferax sp.]|nr:flagellar export chaperone FliS [Rhodoferax sp.]